METLTSQNILDTLYLYRDQLRAFTVQKIGLFGSYSRDDFQTESDLDFLVTLEHKTLDNYMNLKFFLEDLFNRKVDLVIESSLKPRLRPHVLSEIKYVQGL